MNEMTLPFRHRILNSSPGGLKADHATSRSRRLPTILNIYAEKHFISLELGEPCPAELSAGNFHSSEPGKWMKMT